MRILIYGINYAPELTGIGKYTGEMAAWLAGQGHEVKVITAFPYYPEWDIHQNYKGKLWMKENIEGVNVVRCPLYVPKEASAVKRIIHEFSFVLGVFPVWFKSLFQKKYDVVFSIAPPFHLSFLPLMYSGIKGTPMVSHIQDLQVDAAKDLGMIKNKSLLKAMFSAEKFILKRSEKVSTISGGMKRKILEKGVPESNMMLFPNWVDENAIAPLPPEQSLRGKFSLKLTDKVILYSGNLGEKQGLEVLINIAKSFFDRPEVQFVICGSGGGKTKLMDLAVTAGLHNVSFFPLQPYEELSALLATADVHLVLQKKSASDLVMPSKLTGILSAGGCAIVTAPPNTSLYDVVKEHNLGILVEPESEELLRAAIESAIDSDLTAYRKNARQYTLDYLSKNSILKRFEKDLEVLTKRR